jgi:cell division protein FtsQ
MTHETFKSYSSGQLKDRRRKLRRQRGFKSLQASWRLVAVGGLAAGLVWIVTLPDWVIRRPEQVAIEGNQILSIEGIHALLPLSYPQSLLHVHPDLLARELVKEPSPIAEANVRRELFPPSLTVRVRERYPVAIAYPPTPPAGSKGRAVPAAKPIGLIDDRGLWIPFESYQSLTSASVLPKLKVRGNFESYRQDWSILYGALQKTAVKVFEVDWQDPGNLILTTELGIVHCGSDRALVPQQLQVLDRMRQLPQAIKLSQIAYIDLKKPDAPFVKMKAARPAPAAK